MDRKKKEQFMDNISDQDKKRMIYSFEETEPSIVSEASEKYVLSKRSKMHQAFETESEGAADWESDQEAKTPLVPRLVSEVLAEYEAEKQQGEYTLEDYLALPKDQRAELIDGMIFEMQTPNYIHQAIALRVSIVFQNYIDKNHGQCSIFGVPLDVQLDCDDKTVVEPDIQIICDRNKFRDGRVFGAPDLVVEILSKSTSAKDRGLKLAKYKRAGVREYWIIDPRRQRVWVYEFGKSDAPAIYTFEDRVPVGIFGGECKVDFAEIYRRIADLYDTM